MELLMRRAERISIIGLSPEKIALLLGFLFLGIFLVLQVSPILNKVTYDESNLVYDGVRLVRGQVPYKDFFNFVPPVTFYLLAGTHPLFPNLPETAERYLVVIFVLATTFLWFGSLRRLGWPRIEAFGVAAVFPICIYPFNPFAAHHWFSFTFLICAIAVCLVLLKQHKTTGWWILPGFLAGLSLCTLQTSGFFSCVFIALFLLFSEPEKRAIISRGMCAIAGCLVALALCLGPEVFMGYGSSIWRDLVVWPLINYHQPNNLNDVTFIVDLPGRVSALWTFSGNGYTLTKIVSAFSGTLLYTFVIGAVVICLVAAAVTLERVLMRKRPNPIAGSTAILTLIILVVITRCNPTFVHFVNVLPVLIFLWMSALPWEIRADRRHSFIKYGAILFLATALLYRGSLLVLHLPASWQITDVDRVDRDSPLNKSIREISWLKPGDSIAVIPAGGAVYLYTYPAAIGYTYFFPLQNRYNDLEDHRIVARQIAVNKPSAIIIHKVSYRNFLSSADPVSRVIESCYRKAGESKAVVLLARTKGCGKS